MLRQVVSSASVLSVGYDDTTETLEVEFWQGEVYRYTGVPRTVYDDLLRAESIGDFFNVHVRDAYTSARVH
jgi:hypothetical protein